MNTTPATWPRSGTSWGICFPNHGQDGSFSSLKPQAYRLSSPLWRLVVAGGGVILWVKRKSRLAGMRAAILEQNQKQGIPSPRAEHKAKLLALGDLIRKRTELVSRDARASGLKRAAPCHVCLSSDRTARAEPLLLIAEGDTPFRVALLAEMREHPG